MKVLFLDVMLKNLTAGFRNDLPKDVITTSVGKKVEKKLTRPNPQFEDSSRPCIDITQTFKSDLSPTRTNPRL